MKNVFYFITFILIFTSCQKDPQNSEVNLKSDFSLGDTLFASFENISLNNLSDSNSVTYNWDFGDGVRSTDRNPIHKYETPGNYTIKLIVSDNAGNSDSSIRKIRVGERYVYEIDIVALAEHKWYDINENWDEDSTGIASLPDVFFEIRTREETSLYTSQTVYNTSQSDLPVIFRIPDIKISPGTVVGIGSSGIYLNDKDGSGFETIASNLLSGVQVIVESYDRTNHIGEFTIGFYSEYTVKYKIK